MLTKTASVKSAVHLLLFSVALGGGVMHSYIVSPIAFKYLKREEFSNLQNKVFPIYFAGQTAIPILIGLSSPLISSPSKYFLAASAFTGLLNLVWVLPKCKSIKEARNKLVSEKKHEITIEGETKVTEEMAALNKQFGMYHGFSSLFNLVSLVTLGAYGVAFLKAILV